jgi:hypothetical protein
LSKPAAAKGLVCAFGFVSVLAIISIAVLVIAPARHPRDVTAAAASPATTAAPAAQSRIRASYAALPLAFEQNQGQTDPQVKYLTRGSGYTLFLTGDDAVFALHTSARHANQRTLSKVRGGAGMRPTRGSRDDARKDLSAVVRMHLVGANSLAKVAASGQLPGVSNYFIGNDPSKWRSGVARYARVSYQDVYPGVNMAFHGAQQQLEFDFLVAPGANPAPIGFHFKGAQGMKTDDSGNLVITSAAGDVLLHRPVAYQEHDGAREAVAAQFVLKSNNQVSFALGNYDHSRELVIDPSVSYAYSTYLGGSGDDTGHGIAFDSSGNAYVTGQTASQTFPGTTGGFTGTAQVFVTKIAADGSSLIYSTYVGGNGTDGDSGNAIAVDSSGDAYVAGGTDSANFPHTAGAFQTALGSSSAVSNAFIFELNPAGNALTYSTYLGGSDDDLANGIAVDGSGNAYVAGFTSSSDFPTLNPLQTSPGTNSGFVTKLNSTGTALVYSTYLALGGAVGDSVNALALDSSGNVYVTGVASSSAFQTTSGAFQTTCGCSAGATDAFVTVINSAGSAYVYSTFLGGSQSDVGNGIAVDSSGDAYVTGDTESSTDFPTTTGALQTTYGGGTDAFVTKLNPGGTALLYSTYLGGSGFDVGEGIAVDGSGNAYVTGQTASSNFPTASPTQAGLNGGNNTASTDAFVSEANTAGSQLIFSTYLGGAADEDGTLGAGVGAIAVDAGGDSIYVTGNTASTSADTPPFPTQSAVQANNGGGNDAYVVKYTQPSTSSPSFSLSAAPTSLTISSPGGSATTTVTVTAAGGFSGTVTLSCTVSSAPTGAVDPPTCGSATATPGTPGTLTVNTTGATSLLRHTLRGRSSGLFYAMFLPVSGMALLGFGSVGSRRKRLFGFLLLGLLLSGVMLMPACGGSSNGGGGGGGSSGTTTGNYTITVTGTSSGATETGTSPSLTVTVN